MFVLDEADEMLSRGFKDQIYEIFQKLSTNIQVSQRPDARHWTEASSAQKNCAKIALQVLLVYAMVLAEYHVEEEQ